MVGGDVLAGIDFTTKGLVGQVKKAKRKKEEVPWFSKNLVKNPTLDYFSTARATESACTKVESFRIILTKNPPLPATTEEKRKRR